MTTYDPAVMQKLVDKLNARAVAVLIYYPTAGVALGWGGMFYAYQKNPSAGAVGLIVGGVIMGGLIGLAIGQHQSAALKVQAQTLLSQMKIEENTRK